MSFENVTPGALSLPDESPTPPKKHLAVILEALTAAIAAGVTVADIVNPVAGVLAGIGAGVAVEVKEVSEQEEKKAESWFDVPKHVKSIEVYLRKLYQDTRDVKNYEQIVQLNATLPVRVDKKGKNYFYLLLDQANTITYTEPGLGGITLTLAVGLSMLTVTDGCTITASTTRNAKMILSDDKLTGSL